jgi:hypothetical protein
MRELLTTALLVAAVVGSLILYLFVIALLSQPHSSLS